MNHQPIKVAIVGGGCAAVAAAFELTRPEQHGRYQVTLYQVGWRLGGKGASGRGPAGRIEEHGLHLWMGFYENAFRLTRECYAELNRATGSCPIVDWQDAFVPAPGAGVADRGTDGGWSTWTALLPPGGGLPGDPGRDFRPWTVTDYILRSIGLIGALLERVATPRGSAPRSDSVPRSGLLDGEPDAVLANMLRLLRQLGPLTSVASVIEATRLLQVIVGAFPAYPFDQIKELFDVVERAAQQQLDAVICADEEVRRVWEIVDILLAVVRGSLRFGLLTDPRGFDAIDEYDCREWLMMNGASERSVNGPFVRGLHDLALACENGDPHKLRFAAGQGLRGSFRAFLTYRGAFFWKMQAGMGDVVFAPFYEVLARRGVRFEFFHRLRNVGLVDAADVPHGTLPHVERLEFDVQAETVGGGPYRPLVDVRGLPCWPSEPEWTQLVDGAVLASAGVNFESHWDTRRVRAKTLHVTKDFDFVVLGIGLGAVPFVCRELIARSPRWRQMVDRVGTVATQAFQLWLREDTRALGWSGPDLSAFGAFVDPFDTWADMSHLAAREAWTTAPRSIAYFCGALEADADLTLEQARARVRDAAVQYLNRDVHHLWPAAARDDRFRWDLLVDPAEGDGASPSRTADERRFDSQFWTANVNPSDRYVQSLPGTSSSRISPLEQQFDNLTVAGDWTACNLDIGCVEAAVMSGRLAAHAISQSPPLADIVGFDHP